MKTFTWSFIVFIIIVIGCTDNEDLELGHRLFETNHSQGYSRLQFIYTNDRIDEILQFNGNVVYTYLKVNYFDNTKALIKFVHPIFTNLFKCNRG